MKKTVFTAALLAASLSGWAADVNVSIGISQPGVYGRIDIGQYPQPVLVQPRPVIIGRPVVVRPEPVYLWVPPSHRSDWRRYCGRYQACGVPVYFVDSRWYDDHVLARGHERRQDRREDRRDDRHDRRDDRRDDRHDRRDDRRDDRRN